MNFEEVEVIDLVQDERRARLRRARLDFLEAPAASGLQNPGRQFSEPTEVDNNRRKPKKTTSTMATTQQSNNNSNNDDSDNDTNDCPICLCPLSNAWGVCTPCGHAYCRGCWDQLTASHCSDSRRGNKPNCAVCKTVCTQFVTVFVDLNVQQQASLSSNSSVAADASGGGTAAAAKAGAHDMSQLNNDETDEKLDQLTNDWDKLWKELEAFHPGIIIPDDDENSEQGSDDNHTMSSDWDHGQREVAAICANFMDLTQSSNHHDDDDDSGSESQVPLSFREAKRDKQTDKKALQQKEQTTNTILRRLKQIHREIMELQLEIQNQSSTSSSGPNVTTRYTQKLRSKIIKLQSTNADLISQQQSHQSTVDGLTNDIETYKTKLTERTVETEREKRRAEKIASEFRLMEQSYEKHVSKSSIEIQALKSDIRRLQDQNTKLSSQSGLQDLKEMEEIRRKYSKMSQDVHSLRSENARLTKRLEDERAVYRREQMVLSGGGSGGVARSTTTNSRQKQSRKVSLDGRRLVSKGTTKAKTSIGGLAAFPPHRSKSKEISSPKKSKAMEILDNTQSRKHSLQQNSLMMSVKRKKTTTFAKAKARR
jgi:hypothetical protein